MKLIKSVVYVGVLGILSHFIGEALPRKIFCLKAFPFRPFGFEKSGKIFLVLKVKKWKDKVPDMSKIARDMLPKRISQDATSNDLLKLAKETCVAESVHHALNIMFIGIYFIWKNNVGVFLVILSVALNTPYIIIQRYNRPKLISLAEKLSKREEKKNACFTSIV